MDIATLMGAQAGAGGSGLSGWGRVGRALGAAGGASEQRVYDAALARQHDLERKLAEARIKRDEALAREQLQTSIEGIVKDPAQAAAISTIMRGDFGNFDQTTQGLGNLIENEARQGALAAAMRGDTDAANRLISVGKGEPLKVRDIEAGQEYSPYLGNGIPTTITPVGAAEIRRDDAAAEASLASAEKSRRPPQPRTRAGTPKDDLKEAAKDAYYQARAEGEDLEGVTQGDIAYALETRGEWTSPKGRKVRYAVDGFEAGPVDIAAAMLDGSGGNANASPAPATSAPRATRVAGTTREPYQPRTQRGADFQAAQAAIEAGKSYEAVVKRMLDAGYPDAATILKRKR